MATQLNQNQFGQLPIKGQLDLQRNQSSIDCTVNDGEPTPLVCGQAVKLVDAVGPMKVTAVTSPADDVFGFVNYSQKDIAFAAGARVGISFDRGNVMFMQASAAIARNAKVMVVVSGQQVALATTGNTIVGRALDKATASGQLIRVICHLPGSLAP